MLCAHCEKPRQREDFSEEQRKHKIKKCKFCIDETVQAQRKAVAKAKTLALGTTFPCCKCGAKVSGWTAKQRENIRAKKKTVYCETHDPKKKK